MMLSAGLETAVLVGSPERVLAHVVGPSGGVELELLLVAGALLVASFLVRPSEGESSRLPIVLLVLAVVVGLGSFAWPRLNTSPDASPSTPAAAEVRIVEPADGATVAAGKLSVTVELANAPLARSADSQAGGHIHIYVGGKLYQMPYSLTAEIELKPGTHELTVEYVDAQHGSFDPLVEDTVTVTAE